MVLKVDVPTELVRGEVDEGYGPVADAFRRNFAERGEIGAACAVYRNGRKVVDLWGGYRDGRTRTPWRADTVVVMYSTTKGVSSLAHSRALLDHDERFRTYWPEFAWRGKENITVRQLLSYQAGLPVIDVPLTVGDLGDLDVLAMPLGIDVHIGLPAGFDLERRDDPWQRAVRIPAAPWRAAARHRDEHVQARQPVRPGLRHPPELLVDVIGEPRAVAAAYGTAVTGKLGLTEQTLTALVQPARPPSEDPIDLVLRVPAVYSLGYCKPVPRWPFGGTANTAFGTSGNGGSFGFADPETGIGYCYAPNRLGFGLTDPRETALRERGLPARAGRTAADPAQLLAHQTKRHHFTKREEES